MKGIFGFLAVLLGFVGFAACVAGIVAVLNYKDEVSDRSVKLLDAIHENLGYASDKLDQAQAALGQTRKTLNAFDEMIQRIREKAAANEPRDKKLDQVQQNVATSIDSARSSVDGAENQAKTIDKTISMMQSFPFASLGKPLVETLKKAANNMVATAPLVTRLKEQLDQIDFDEDVGDETIDKVAALVKQIDERLTEAEGNVDAFRDNVKELRSETDRVREEAPSSIQQIAFLLIALLVWIGLGQFCLAAWGWHWMRRKPAE